MKQVSSKLSQSNATERKVPRVIAGLTMLGLAMVGWMVTASMGADAVKIADVPKDNLPTPSKESIAFFDASVKPLLDANCAKCHGGEKIKGGLVLFDQESILKGGDTGSAVNLQKPAESLLLKAISFDDPELQMPPKKKMSAEEQTIFKKWIEMGLPMTQLSTPRTAVAETVKKREMEVNAENMKFWSFQPNQHPEIPKVKNASWIKSPVDAFVLAKLEAHQLQPNGPASKLTMIRRAYYDLTGLPPTPAEVESFLKDESPDAYPKLIEKLLASPRYGEKWARHWLDVVRYAETNSFERDNPKPNAWRYRDYVIDAFNSDKPYDQFVTEQIAGDEMPHPTAAGITATGFLRLGLWDDEPADRLQAKFDEFDDIVTTVAQSFIGLTVNCARCHNHKIDPIPQKDYYQLLAFFRGLRPNGTAPENVLTEIVPDSLVKAASDEDLAVMQRTEQLQQEINKIESPVIAQLPKGAEKLPKLRQKRQEFLNPRVKKEIGEDPFKHYEQLVKELTELESRAPSKPLALSAKEVGPNPEPTFILSRGNAHVQGAQVQPGFISILNPPAAEIPVVMAGAKSSGRRSVLAKWLTSPTNPLPARVMANRIFQHHFGRGIVKSPNDFGNGGDRPTHPELLDFLADEFVKGGWKIKSMHRMIMLSNTYQMSSTAQPTALAKDPGNDLFWRFDMRRLTAEEVRDSILAVDGSLNLEMAGPGVYPVIPQAVLAGQSVPGRGWGHSTPQQAARRSIYIHQKRSLVVPILSSLDAADNDSTCPARFTTTQSTQALSLMNSDFTNSQAAVLMKRIAKEAGNDDAAQIKLALNLALCRQPQKAEVERGQKFIASLQSELKASHEEAMKQFCLLVLNLNEFFYLD